MKKMEELTEAVKATGKLLDEITTVLPKFVLPVLALETVISIIRLGGYPPPIREALRNTTKKQCPEKATPFMPAA